MGGQSQSGTGKTAAFVLTMLSRIDYATDAVQAICLAPTRELARQIVDVVKQMGKFTPVRVTLAIREAVKTHVNVFVLDEADNMLDLQGMGEQSMRVKKFEPSR